MTLGAPRSFGAHLKALREAAGYTQEELVTIAGLSVHGVSALERGERRRPHVETLREAYDLREVERTKDNLKMMTKDGLPIIVNEMRVRFSIRARQVHDSATDNRAVHPVRNTPRN